MLEQKETSPGTSEEPIRYGSIIHLQNIKLDDSGKVIGSEGYLGSNSSVIDKDVLGFRAIEVLAFTSTHIFENRLGSGSWELLSAEKKEPGESVEYGDKIRLRNMRLDEGYLDTFDWVDRLAPFQKYVHPKSHQFVSPGAKGHMVNGVFSSTGERAFDPNGNGAWTISSADGNKTGEVMHGDHILLQNGLLLNAGLSGGSYLSTYKHVSKHDMFNKDKDYDGEKMFVFAGFQPDTIEDGSISWAISVSQTSRNFYYLWGQVEGKWLDFGALKIPGLLNKSLIALKLKSDDTGTLNGKVSYAGEGFLDLVQSIDAPSSSNPTSNGGNIYKFSHKLNQYIQQNYPNGEWVFGAQNSKKISAVDIVSTDSGRTFSGTVTYAGEDPIPVRGMQPSAKSFEKTVNEEPSDLFFDFFESDIWEKRIETIGAALNSDNKDIDEIVQLIEPSHESQRNQIKNIGTIREAMQAFWVKITEVANGEVEGSEAGGAIKKLAQQNILPPVHTISNLIRQMTIDLEVVQRAIQQRRPAGSNLQSKSLLITDKLAAMSLAPFNSLLGDGKSITPVTYFDKQVFARLVPYSDQFIFIGLTYDLVVATHESTIPPFELMAIPHEIGHFMYHYQNSKLPGEAETLSRSENAQVSSAKYDHHHSSSKLQQKGHAYKHRPVRPQTFGWLSESEKIKNNPYHHWSEEIFADLYGCLVSGPYTALGIQALLAAGDKHQLMTGDVQHPTPIIRPYLISEMLRVIHQSAQEKIKNLQENGGCSEEIEYWKSYSQKANFNEIAMILDANWTVILDRWGIVLENVFNGRPESIIVPNEVVVHLEPFTRVNIAKMIENGRHIIAHFAEELLSQKYASDLSTVPWCGRFDTLTDYSREFDNLITGEQGLVAEKVLGLYGAYPIHPFVSSAISDTYSSDSPNFIEIGEELFKKVYDAWHDGGGGTNKGGM